MENLKNNTIYTRDEAERLLRKVGIVGSHSKLQSDGTWKECLTVNGRLMAKEVEQDQYKIMDIYYKWYENKNG
jgi:hypothetical protein